MRAFEAKRYHILAIEDDYLIMRTVEASLEQAGFRVSTASSVEDALQFIDRFGLPHLALVDINMPFGMDGLEFCEQVLAYSDLPIVMLTAVNEDTTIVQAIDHYAEDYITKPFNPQELVARVKRVLRRIGDFAYMLEPLVHVDSHLRVNFTRKMALVDGQEVSLTPTETKLLYILMRNAGQTVTTDFMLRRLWPHDRVQDDRLRVYVHRLRRKIERNPRDPYYIFSHRGLGYSFSRA